MDFESGVRESVRYFTAVLEPGGITDHLGEDD
jgi:hypothetical protein